MVVRSILAALAFALAAPAAFAATSPVAIVGKPAITVTFSKRADYLQAPIQVLLQNNANRRLELTVRYVGVGAPPDGIAATPDPQLRKTGLTLAGAPRQIEPHSLVALRLQLRRVGAKPAAAGSLVIGRAGKAGAPLLVAVTEAAATEPITGFEQKQVALLVTRKLGPVPGVCRRLSGWTDWIPIDSPVDCPAHRYSGTSTQVAAHGVNTSNATIVGSGSGGTLLLALEPPASDDGERTTALYPPQATVAASEISARGKYTGQLALDPAAKEPKTIEASVSVQDSLVWPLLAVLAGAFVGGVLVKRHQVRRQGRLLAADLAEAVDGYAEERRRLPDPPPVEARPNRFYLDDELPDNGKGSLRWWNTRRLRWQSDGPHAVSLYRRARRVSNEAAATEVAAGAKLLTDRLARWEQLNGAFKALKAKLDQQGQDGPIAPAGSKLREDADELLDLTGVEPSDDDTTTDLHRRLIEQAAVIDLYDEARRKLPSEPPDFADKHPSVDPKVIYETSEPVLTRTAEQSRMLRFELLRAARLLEHPEAVDALGEGELEESAISDIVRRLDVDMPRGAFPRLGGLARALVLRFDSPAEIRRAVRAWDWRIFWLLAVLTALAYLLPAYTGKDYGSLEDYLTAFAAGAVVPTAINWALIPYAQRAAPASAEKKEKKEGDEAAE